MRLLLTLALLTATALAHPGIGIVVDQAGNVYYTDLKQVWRMAPNGAKTVVVPNVHTHELYLDAAGNLFGEHLWYSGPQDGSGIWHFRVWKRSPDGRVLDVVPEKTGFRKDESFVRDSAGNSYVAGQTGAEAKRKFVRRINPQGHSTPLAAGFTDIRWMAIGADQNLYLVDQGDIVRITAEGKVTTIARSQAERSANPLTWRSDHNLMGLTADAQGNVYVANYGDKKVKKVGRDGQVTVLYRSSGIWSPTGVAVTAGKVFVLESDGGFGAQVKVVALTSSRP